MEVVRLLLEANAKKDKVFDDGSAVLMASEVFRLLSDADADRNMAGTGNEDIAPFFFLVALLHGQTQSGPATGKC